MALDRSRQLAVDALTEKLKTMIEARVAKADARAGAHSSWNMMFTLKGDPLWTGDKVSQADRDRAESVHASYSRDLAKMKDAEGEVWAAIAALLKD